MEWGHFLQVIGSIFATAGLVMLMVFKYVIEAAVPSMVMASFGLGLGGVLLGSLVIYAIPKMDKKPLRPGVFRTPGLYNSHGIDLTPKQKPATIYATNEQREDRKEYVHPTGIERGGHRLKAPSPAADRKCVRERGGCGSPPVGRRHSAELE